MLKIERSGHAWPAEFPIDKSDFPDVAVERDCDPIGEGDDHKDVCLYGEWEEKYCK